MSSSYKVTGNQTQEANSLVVARDSIEFIHRQLLVYICYRVVELLPPLNVVKLYQSKLLLVTSYHGPVVVDLYIF